MKDASEPMRLVSLREEAERLALSHGHNDDTESSYSIHTARPIPSETTISLPYASYPGYVGHPLSEEVSSHISSSQATTALSASEMAEQARREWRRHGSGVTQALEETRQATTASMVVRVISAETRVDVSGANYTSYVIQVQTPTKSFLMEHRYSDFLKLHMLLRKSQVTLETSFPSKHWAGRMGNWMPARTWAPEKHEDLVSYRKVQLDVWLVHVVERYHQGDLPPPLARAVYDFLTVAQQPPCAQRNDVFDQDWSQWNNPLSFTLGSAIRQAAFTVRHMCCKQALTDSDQSIPLDLLHHAKGLCFLTVAKAGLVVSGRVGTGLVIARLSDKTWSAPCALGTLGVGWGAQAGGDIAHYFIVLTTLQAVQALCEGGSVQFGAEVGVAVGPVGRGATSHLSTGDWTLHPAYAYAHSQGLFVGMSIEGSMIRVRQDVNAKFYGQAVESKQVLVWPGPKAAEPLYEALANAMNTEIPREGFRPSQLWNQDHGKDAAVYPPYLAHPIAGPAQQPPSSSPFANS